MRSGIVFDSVKSLLAPSAQRALCIFFSLLLQASLLCCGLMVSSPGPCASSGGRLPEAFFMVFQLDSKGQKCENIVDLETDRKMSMHLRRSASIQLRTSPVKLKSM